MSDFVSVPVPSDRVAEVYALLAAPKPAAPKAPKPTAPPTPSASSAPEPWDEDNLRRFYKESPPNMRGFLRLLAKKHPANVTSIEAGQELKLPKGAQSVAGMLGAAGRRSWNRHQRHLPLESWWEAIQDDQGNETGSLTVFAIDELFAEIIEDMS